jgi:hypothetical protein
MDHVLEGMMTHYEVYLDLFIEEQKRGDYKKLSENPYYKELKAIIGAINVLRKFLGWELLKISEEVNWRLEDGVY